MMPWYAWVLGPIEFLVVWNYPTLLAWSKDWVNNLWPLEEPQQLTTITCPDCGVQTEVSVVPMRPWRCMLCRERYDNERWLREMSKVRRPIILHPELLEDHRVVTRIERPALFEMHPDDNPRRGWEWLEDATQ